MTIHLPTRTAPRLGRPVTALGWGAFKIGRNEAVKYPSAYSLPSESEAVLCVHEVIAAGVRVIDTAPAYGSSEERIGRALAQCDPLLRSELFLSTKAGEQFINGCSHYDFSAAAITRSLDESLRRLRCDRVDIVWIHSDGSDLEIIERGEAIGALALAKQGARTGAVGFSPKTLEGARAALNHDDVDAVMIELHQECAENEPILELAHARGKAVFVKKPLASGRLDPAIALPWILAHPQVSCVVVGGLSAARVRENAAIVSAAARG